MNRINGRKMTQQEERAIDSYFQYQKSESILYQKTIDFVNNYKEHQYGDMRKIMIEIAELTRRIYDIDKLTNSCVFERVKLSDSAINEMILKGNTSLHFNREENKKIIEENQRLVNGYQSELDVLYGKYVREGGKLFEKYENGNYDRIGIPIEEYLKAIGVVVNHRNEFASTLNTLEEQADKKLNVIHETFDTISSIIEMTPILGCIDIVSRPNTVDVNLPKSITYILNK